MKYTIKRPIVGGDLCVDPLKDHGIDPTQNNNSSDNYKINHNGRTQRSAPAISDIGYLKKENDKFFTIPAIFDDYSCQS